MNTRVSRLLVAATAVAVLASACGPVSEQASGAEEVDAAFGEVEESVDAFEDSVAGLGDPSPTTVATEPTAETVEAAPEQERRPASSGVKDPAGGSAQAAVTDLGVVALRAEVEALVGPTADVTVPANRLGFFPSEVPTLPDASVFASSVEMYRWGLDAGVPGDRLAYTNRIGFWSPASAEEAVVFYSAAFEALGYVVTEAATQSDGESVALMFWADMPDAGVVVKRRIEVLVRADAGPGSTVEFTYRAEEPYVGQVEVYTAWSATAPLPAGGVPTSVRFSIVGNGDRSAPSSYYAQIGGGWVFPDLTETEFRAELPALLAGSGDYGLSEFGDVENLTVGLDSVLFAGGAGLLVSNSHGSASVDLDGRWTVAG